MSRNPMARACAHDLVPNSGLNNGPHLRPDTGGDLAPVPGFGRVSGLFGPERSLLGSVPLLAGGVLSETPMNAELGSEQRAVGTLPPAVPKDPVPVVQSPGMAFEDDTAASPLLESALPGGSRRPATP